MTETGTITEAPKPPTIQEKTAIRDLMENLEDKLDGEIGNMWWKVYIASAFWSNISTPINLSITLLSAITAGQATTNNLLSSSTFMKLSIAQAMISTLNTFFRPHNQFMQNMEVLKKINEYGFRFEDIYYSPNVSYEDTKRRYTGYKELMIEYQKYKNTMSPEQQNYLTDLIYYISIHTCLIWDSKWLSVDLKYIEDGNKPNNISNRVNKEKKGCCDCFEFDIENQINRNETDRETNINNIDTTNKVKKPIKEHINEIYENEDVQNLEDEKLKYKKDELLYRIRMKMNENENE